MKITDLAAEAERRNITLQRTSIKGTPLPGHVCLSEGYGRWSVFYLANEMAQDNSTSVQRHEKHFFDEADACQYLLELVSRLEANEL